VAKERVSWRDRYPDEVTCVRCLVVKDQMELDRLLWCVDCRRRARERASWWGWAGGLAFGLCVGLYVWFVIEPTDLVIGGWLATLVAAVWIGQKVARELFYGGMRFRNARAVDAVPPGPAEGDAVE
jgi:hypothetical protein